MSTVQAHKTTSKYIAGRMTNHRMNRGRKKHGNRFVNAVFCIGIILVLTFLLWTFAMVLLESMERWHR
jgi:hypothetical protein